MPDPTQRDAELAALRAAEANAMRAVELAMFDTLSEMTLDERSEALDAYGDACKAEARAALLAEGTPIWVATDEGAKVSRLYRNDPQMTDGVAMNDDEDDGLWLWGHAPLITPGTWGTCRAARVVLVPGGGNAC